MPIHSRAFKTVSMSYSPSFKLWWVPPDKRGDDDVNALLAAMGRALCIWETVEVHLAFMFGGFAA